MDAVTGVIAVDGPSGVGKSTVSRALAAHLRIGHLDTGAGYRSAALAVLRSGADPDDVAAVIAAVAQADIEYEMGVAWLDGDDVSQQIRSNEVTAAASRVAAVPEVRAQLVALQRQWVMGHGDAAVVEGRDIGTVVFPDADLKIYLDARPEIRTARRAGDQGVARRDHSTVSADLADRDRRDTERAASPLRTADDAHVIDTSDLTADEVLAQILALLAMTNDVRG